MAGTKFHEAALDIRVERDLKVTMQPTKPAVGPGEEVEVEVTTVDQLGKPVSAVQEEGALSRKRQGKRKSGDPAQWKGRVPRPKKNV